MSVTMVTGDGLDTSSFSPLHDLIGAIQLKLVLSEDRLFLIGPFRFQVLWKSYIDFEIEQEEFGNTRNLYKRLLQRTQHVKVRGALQTDAGAAI